MMDTMLMQSALAGNDAAGPRVALVVTDPARRHRFASLVAQASVTDADAILVDLAIGEAIPALSGPVLLLTDEPSLLALPPSAGALPRDATMGQVMAALSAIAQGLQVRSQPGRPNTLADYEGPALTPRELEVLALVGHGQSNKGIARRLGISAHTVKYHLEAVFAKLGARTRAEAVSLGLRRGLVRV
jgi:DNA-binding NarL/FixJ family response regulator